MERNVWRDYIFLSEQSIVTIINGSEAYVFDDKFIFCASNAEAVSGFDPTVQISMRD
jgi:hypothetical protein